MVRASPLAKAFMSTDGPALSQWRPVHVKSSEQQKQLRLDRASHTATVANGAIYVIAGRKGSAFYADVLRFDIDKHEWRILCPAIPNGFRSRANHTATLVGGRHIWVVAGSDNEQVIGDVHIFDVLTHTWTKPQIRGDNSLLSRTAHSAELHPSDPRVVLLFGGYDGAAFHNDVVLLHTHTLSVERIVLNSGSVPPPVPRGYHSCTAAGSRCYIYGGRTEAGVVNASEMLAVYDAAVNRWLKPQVEGAWPQARSSHRTVALGNRLLIHGGAAAGEQIDRLADVHTLMICPSSGRLIWSRMDEPPPTTGSASNFRPQGRSAHTVSLVGTDSLYIISGYVGASSGPHRYSGDVFQMQLGVPASEQSPTLPQVQAPSPRHSRGPQQPSPQRHTPKQGRASPRTSAEAQGATVNSSIGNAHNGASTSNATAGVTNGKSMRPASPLCQNPAAAIGAAAQHAKRRLPPEDRAQAPAHHQQAPLDSTGSAYIRRVDSGAGAQDDPIDLTAEQPLATTPLKDPGEFRRSQPAPRVRVGVSVDGVGGAAKAAPAESAWLGGHRRSRGGCGPSRQPQASEDVVAAVTAKAAGAPRSSAVGLQGRPLQAQAVGDAIASRPAKRLASDAAVAAALAVSASPPSLPQRGRVPVQILPSAAHGNNDVAVPAAVGVVPAAHLPQSPQQQQQHHPALGSGVAHGHGGAAALLWQAQAEVYGLPAGTIAAAATATATAAVAATTVANNGAGGGYRRPPSPPQGGVAAANSQEAFLTQLLQDNQSLRRQLQEAQEAERLVAHKLTAQQEDQRRTAEELSTQRQSCEMTQAALRSANMELEEARSQLEHVQQELAEARQQAAAQQQHAMAAQQAADRERVIVQERAVLMQQQVEDMRKYQEQVKSLEALCDRHQAEVEKHRRDLRAEVERHSEEMAAQNDRLNKRDQDVVELTIRLRDAAVQNQKLQQDLGHLQDLKQRLERDISEAREAQQRLQRQMDEQIGDLARQRDSLQMQLTHANSRLSTLKSELRRTTDDLAHRDAQHAALLQANADKVNELAGIREQLRAVQQRHEVLRQQAGLLVTQMQTMQATAQAMASGS
ncbi:hypothetical protein VaNZ11_011821 [Volvox africanus]|uniref:Uncharacterized protein n=1 Tax=Volvox africanus TaxID=51714 RepID=A0ABQ5SCB5_9CHLO|nr:hypothetical protein VaNZ11_011821 [Volvox africanus]